MDWKKIKAEYIAGGTSYRKLAEKHGVSFNTLKTRATEEQWYKLRQQKDNKTTTKIVETISTKQAEEAVDIIDVANKLLEKIVEVMGVVGTTQDIRHLTSALKDLREIKGVKSDRDIREQEARIRNLEKQAETEQKDNEIRVVIESNLDEFSS